MTKIRKQKKRKVYRYDVNRKRMKNKMKRRPKVQCAQLKVHWDKMKTAHANLRNMGLTSDVNETFKIQNNKWCVEEMTLDTSRDGVSANVMSQVAMELEEEAKAPRPKNFRLPNSQVYWITKLIDRYGEDYQAMAKDRKMNYFQETWKQLRSKIQKFKNIPEQYNEYLNKKKELEQNL